MFEIFNLNFNFNFNGTQRSHSCLHSKLVTEQVSNSAGNTNKHRHKFKQFLLIKLFILTQHGKQIWIQEISRKLLREHETISKIYITRMTLQFVESLDFSI